MVDISQPPDTLLNGDVAVFCLATGYPIPYITWQKNGVDIDVEVGRFSIFDFLPQLENGTFESGGFMMGSGGKNIVDLLRENTNFTSEGVLSLGGLGIVSTLSFASVQREDTANYTCTASNQLPQTTRISRRSNSVPLIILGEYSYIH